MRLADRAARHKKEQQMENRLVAKKRKKASKPPKESTPARKLGKVLLGRLMVICVVGIVCFAPCCLFTVIAWFMATRSLI